MATKRIFFLSRRLVLVVVLLGLVFAMPGCTSYDKQVFDDLRDLFNEDRESQSLKQTAAAKFATLAAGPKAEVESVFGTLIAKVTEVAPSVFGTLVAGQRKGPFNLPTLGYLGMKYGDLYPETKKAHTGLDIWASETPMNNGQIGNPVYAVYDGKLGLTGSGVEICHPQLDTTRYPDLPYSLVCTYYGHLTDLPEKFAKLRKDACPNDMVDVKQGDLLGYMDTPKMSNNIIVHLHFSVVKQNPANGCWIGTEVDINNTLTTLPYLGLDDKNYVWLDPFP